MALFRSVDKGKKTYRSFVCSFVRPHFANMAGTRKRVSSLLIQMRLFLSVYKKKLYKRTPKQQHLRIGEKPHVIK